MATKKRKPASRKAKQSQKRKSRAPRKRRQVVLEPSSGSLDSTLDPRSRSILEREPATENPGAQPSAGGAQSGDLEGLETDETEAYESVKELADEGQDLQAEEVEAAERALDPDQGELKPRKVPNRQKSDFNDRNRL